MSRGKKVFFSGLVLMGLSSFLAAANPAGAQAVSSGPVAGAANIAPGPVEEVKVEVGDKHRDDHHVHERPAVEAAPPAEQLQPAALGERQQPRS